MSERIMQQRIDNDVRQSKSRFEVAIIVLNWNGWRDTIECLESLQRLTYPNYQIIVVDNESTDGSVGKIKTWAQGETPVESKFFDYDPHTKPVRWIEYDRATAETGGVLEKENTLHQLAPNRRLVLIRSGENLGIAGGYNVGIRYALGRQFEYIWIMNNDTVIDPSCVDLCVRTFDSDHRIGVVGPKILWYDDPSRIWYAGARLRLRRGDIADVGIGELDGDDYSGIRITEFVSGCALLTRRETLEEVGLLDEDYFALHEDVDWSYRVQRTSHFTLAANLDAQVWHKEGGISSSGRVSPISTYFANKNRFLVVSKHGSWSEKFSFAMFYLLSRPMKFLLLLAKGKKHLVRAELKAMIHFLTGQYGLSDGERISSWRRR